MTRSIAVLFAALALTATTAAAQSNVQGTVKYIDPANRMIYLTDGRSMKIEPGSQILIDGREVSLDAIKPGQQIVMAPAAPRPATTTLTSHPPIDATGTVASVDRQNGVITLQDGRQLKIGAQTFVWQPTRLDDLRPGETVFLRHAQPVIASGLEQGQQVHMGTVLNVDPANALVMLNDGTLIRVMPATKMHMRNKTLTLSDLRPGDEVVITPRAPAMSTAPSASVAHTGSDVSALPRFGHVTIDASDIQVMRGVQAP